MLNKKSAVAAVLVIGLGGLPLLLAQDRGDRVGFKDSIIVGAGETRDNVVSFGGDIIVEGKVRKTVFALGGSITISGEVGEAVVGIGSDITLKSTAVIKGDLVGLGGSVFKEPGFSVEGDTVFFKASELTGKLFSEGLKGIFSVSFWPIILVFKLVSIFVWLLLAFVVAALFPRQVVTAAEEARRSFWPALAMGLAAVIIFTFFTLFAAVLCLVLIGIPILLSLILAGLAIKIFGRVVVFYLFGESIVRAFNRQKVSPLGGTMAGLLILSLIGFVPVLGFLATSVLNILGWGIVLRTKFGTTANWFHRRARPDYPAQAPPPQGTPPFV
jgi:hypothetical protein